MKMRVLLAALVLAACGGTAAVEDAGSGRDAGGCREAADCDDGLFCNGAEACAPGERGADARGCAPGAPPCPEGCNEAADTCSGCADADGDGARDVSCGGSDCDDADPNRHPGALEVCDAIDRDEDCDPTTFGVLDADLDGFPDSRCCNVDASGEPICGTDCDDASAFVNPSAPEICDSVDNDCNDAVDEEAAPATWYRDADGDGAGDPATTTVSCTPPGGYVLIAGDCDDANVARRPGRAEACDGLDNDCNDAADDGTIPGIGDDCTTGEPGECNRGVMTCGGTAGPTCTRRAAPASETCNALDDDCDTRIDEDVAVGAACEVPGAVGECRPGTTVCDGAAGLRCVGRGPAPELCSPQDESCDGNAYEGLTCAPGDTRGCSVCGGTMSGTQTCTGSCGWPSECEVPGRGPFRRYADDPAFDFPAVCTSAHPTHCTTSSGASRTCGEFTSFGGYCYCTGQRCAFNNGTQDGHRIDGYSTSPARRLCVDTGEWGGSFPFAHPSGGRYCLAGGAVTLGPGRYRVRVRYSNGYTTVPILEAWDVTSNIRRQWVNPPADGGTYTSELVFDHPIGSCARYEFRVPSIGNSGTSGPSPLAIEWIEWERVTPILLPAP